ncbi:M28 family peptidase [Flavobacteriaceae bacterium R38]|nr:M28 family peptidase [Flavobacteriaceae bacterium R38]
MKLRVLFFSILFSVALFTGNAQTSTQEAMLAKIRDEGFRNSKAMEMVSYLTDVYGQRLTGTREYLAAAKWISEEMKKTGLQNVHFEKYCNSCRGWQLESFNVEMVAPNYMHIEAYPLVMSKSSNGIVTGEVVHIESISDMNSVRQTFGGKLKGKVILYGKAPQKQSLDDKLSRRFSEDELHEKEKQLTAKNKQTPLPELLKSWETDDFSDDEFLRFAEAEGALAILKTRAIHLGILHPQGTYYYKNGDLMPLPYFTIMPEHFGRLARMLQLNVTPKIRLNLETSFYHEPENNVNILGELTGTDPKLKSETVLVGAHFDSWHSGTGATDNGANSVILIEALRILKEIGFTPKRTIRIGLWEGEEQAFIGSVDYGKAHFGALDKKPNKASTKVSAYLNLDNGSGAIRGLYLQNNEYARPALKKIFNSVSDLTEGTLTIENTLSTDHETFDHYNIPSFQFIQDPLEYNTATHHTQLDVLEYVREDDIMKNAVILAWTLYSISELDQKIPRKTK